MLRYLLSQTPLNRCALRVVAPMFILGNLLTGSAGGADIQVRDLEDINLGTVPPTVGNIRGSATFCVAMRPRGRYSLLGTGDGPGGRFAITETGTGVHRINYNVRVSDRGNRRGQRLRAGIPLRGLRASRFRNNGRCTPRARVDVIVRAADTASAHPGRYEGTLTLTVVPE